MEIWRNSNSENDNVTFISPDEAPAFNPEQTREKATFSGDAIFPDIDGTITNNTGRIDQEAVDKIKYFSENGGAFVPVTGRARFESVRDIVETLDLQMIVINNGAEIFNRNGEHIYKQELTDEEVQTAFSVAEKNGLVWMQNKRDENGEEYLFSNFTPETEAAMLEAGIVDNVHNEEGRIGLAAKQATAEEVMAIPGQNFKIQMMSPNFEAVKAAYDEFQRLGIPCMLNMQSAKTGQFHWVEVIRGTKHEAIQWLIEKKLPETEHLVTIGDGGNDIGMLTADYLDGEGKPIENTSIAVRNASESVVNSTKALTLDRFNESAVEPGEENFGVAVAGVVDMFEEKHRIDEATQERKSLIERARKAGIILPGMPEWNEPTDDEPTDTSPFELVA